MTASTPHSDHIPAGYYADEIEDGEDYTFRRSAGTIIVQLDGEYYDSWYHYRRVEKTDDFTYQPWRVGGYRNGRSYETLAEAKQAIDATP